jgi:hypothetical protein
MSDKQLYDANCRRRDELFVLGLISVGLIVITLAVVLGLFLDNNGLPNWAENVLVAIATAAALKLGDCIAALIALSTGRQVENFGNQLAQATPTKPVPESVEQAAEQVAGAAQEEASRIGGEHTSER